MSSTLTGSELKAYKRQQRMIRNRESASLSRQRRKAHLEEVERRNEFLEKENSNLKHDNTLLMNKLKTLQGQLDNYQCIVFKSV